MMFRLHFLLASAASVLLLLTATGSSFGAEQPKAGDEAADFQLKSLDGKDWKLSQGLKQQPVVLIVLRGFPGYQCPVCNKQVGEHLQAAEQFKSAGARVVFVYPGPEKQLAEKAKEFYKDKTIPDHFTLLIDPDYEFTNRYHLRWDAPRETAYPATFVIDKGGKIAFASISTGHGGRTTPAQALDALAKLK